MDHQQDNPDPQSFPGAVPMARIDGGKIRRLRESRGLTQLYLSTVVGVTTDTISRWENRRYQSIKLENAEKLAQALEVAMAEILDQQQNNGNNKPQTPTAPEVTGEKIPPDLEMTGEQIPPSRLSRKHIAFLAGIIVILAASLPFFFRSPEQPLGEVTAERILPPHVPPGQSFPVLIRIRTAGSDPVTLIVRESIPPACTPLGAVPAVISFDRREHSLKWIGRTGPDRSLHGYACQVSAGVSHGEKLGFKGTVTLKEEGGDRRINGAASVVVAPFHWADTNRDNRIDDEEILAVYEDYSDIAELNFDRDLIDSIWAGDGYVWDEEQKRYLVSE